MENKSFYAFKQCSDITIIRLVIHSNLVSSKFLIMAAEVNFFFFFNLNEIKYWHLNVLSAIRVAAGCYPFFLFEE